MITRMFPNLEEASCWRKEKRRIHLNKISILIYKPANVAKSSSPKKKTVRSAPLKKSDSFFEDVYDVVRQIPKGRVTSYGAVASYLGTKMSARMVGWAMNGAFNIKPKVPAHRVVNRNGMLSGKAHFNPPSKMQELLEKEKIKVENDTIVNFDQYFGDPSSELSL